jgi:cell volume regulation protein A
VEGDIVDYAVAEDSRAAGRLVRELALPDGVVISLIARQEQLIPPQGRTRIEPGDHVILVLRSGTRPLVDRVFARSKAISGELPPAMEFPLRGSITVEELEGCYGIRMRSPAKSTLDEAIRAQLMEDTKVGSTVRFDQIVLRVREMSAAGTIEQVGMTISTMGGAPDHP